MLERLLLVGQIAPPGNGENNADANAITVPFEEVLLSLLIQINQGPPEGFDQGPSPREDGVQNQPTLILKNLPKLPPELQALITDTGTTQEEGNGHKVGTLPEPALRNNTQTQGKATQPLNILVGTDTSQHHTQEVLPKGSPNPMPAVIGKVQIQNPLKPPEMKEEETEVALYIRQEAPQPQGELKTISGQPLTVTDAGKDTLSPAQKTSRANPADLKISSSENTSSHKEPSEIGDLSSREEREGVVFLSRNDNKNFSTEPKPSDRPPVSPELTHKKHVPSRSETQQTATAGTPQPAGERPPEETNTLQQVQRKEIPHNTFRGEVKSVSIKLEDTQLNFRFNTLQQNLSVEVRTRTALENYITFLDAGKLQKTLSMLGVGLESMRINGNEIVQRSGRTLKKDLRERDIIDRNEGIAEKADSRPFNSSGLNLFL